MSDACVDEKGAPERCCPLLIEKKTAAISFLACGWRVRSMTCRGVGVGEGVDGVGVPPKCHDMPGPRT